MLYAVCVVWEPGFINGRVAHKNAVANSRLLSIRALQRGHFDRGLREHCDAISCASEDWLMSLGWNNQGLRVEWGTWCSQLEVQSSQGDLILRIQRKLNTALLSTVRPCVRAFVTGVTSHISHIYKGINTMLIISGPIKPYTFLIKIILAIFLAKTRPDKTIFSALTNLTIDFDFELSKI